MDAHGQSPKPERSSILTELQQIDSVLTGLQPVTPSVKVEEQSMDNSHGALGHPVSPTELERQANDDAESDTSWSSNDTSWSSGDSNRSQAMEIDTKFDNFLSELREDRVKQNEMIQSRLDKIDTSIQALKVQRAESSTSPVVKRLREQLKTEREQLKTVKKQHGNVKKENSNLNKIYNALFRNYGQQKEELEKTKVQLHEALAGSDQQRLLMDGRSLVNASKETDGTIIGLWTQIAYDIRQLAHLLANPPGTQELDDNVTRRLRFITADYRKFFSDEDHCIDLMQGYLWVMLKNSVFDGKISSGNYDSPECKVALANAARCLAQMSTMFSELWDEDGTLINSVINEETKIMEPFSPKHHGRTDRADQKVRRQLKDIFRAALKLDRIILTSKAIFERRWQDPFQKPGGFQLFNEDYMTSDNHETVLTPKSRILFCVSPMLLKTGTADGQNYDSMIVLQKAKVVCN
ncbi:hypothetical protein FSPOR_4068 [Fusarium sporotrichioides]|uniref:Uncharacterized protein n=1 Tax=Fusarium sporotrichioides TaxID=5514 RepID=A0A395SDQ6_FUSSP|nr:hypothetical protein FSPOR_4068 [Fusarium sporotrichioides]